MISLFFPVTNYVSAIEKSITIYKVNTNHLIVREEQSVKSKALFSLPRDSYVLNYSDMQSQEIVTIANLKGRWINVCGMNGNLIGYVFEGFLLKTDDLRFSQFEYGCGFDDKFIKCGDEIFEYTDKTPIFGAWFKNPETLDGNMTYISDQNSSLLKKILTSPGENISTGGDVVMILKNNKIVQFISTPPPRGGGY